LKSFTKQRLNLLAQQHFHLMGVQLLIAEMLFLGTQYPALSTLFTLAWVFPHQDYRQSIPGAEPGQNDPCESAPQSAKNQQA
jgi:hypothetical protein